MPRRILLLITDLEIGGTPTVVRELASRLHAPPRVHVKVACLADLGPVGVQLRERGIDVTAFNAGGIHEALRVANDLANLITDRRIDTVVSFLIHANAMAAAASCMTPGVRFIQSIQTTQPEPRWHWRLQRWIARRAERFIVPSPSVASVAMEWSGVPREKIVVIPNAIDSALFDVPREPGDTFRVGFIGRLDPIKRIPDLVEAVAPMSGPMHLHIFGEGADRSRVEQSIIEHDMRDRATLHGAIARPQDALRRMDVLVLPSAAEGFGLVLIEAMAAGVPVVATNVQGIRDVVQNGETGLLVPAGDVAALRAAIERVRDDPTLRERLIEAGRRDVRARFTLSAVVPQYRALLGA